MSYRYEYNGYAPNLPQIKIDGVIKTPATSYTLSAGEHVIEYITNKSGIQLDGCTGITEITVPPSFTSWGSFKNVQGSFAFTVPKNVSETESSYENYNFQNCQGLTAVTIPSPIKTIGTAAFSGCSNLKLVNLSDSLETIEDSAFTGCTSLSILDISSCTNLQKIGRRAFAKCGSLKKLVLPNTTPQSSTATTLHLYCFYGCTGLTSVTIGTGIKKLYRSCFAICNSLTNISYRGTIAQWNAISKDPNWKGANTPATVVHCSDGDVSI